MEKGLYILQYLIFEILFVRFSLLKTSTREIHQIPLSNMTFPNLSKIQNSFTNLKIPHQYSSPINKIL